MRLRDLMPRWKQIVDIDQPEDVYLSRLMLLRTPWLGVYVHIIRRPDWARCEHDHPWPFVTFVLRGGYEEEIGGRLFVRHPGYIGYRPRSFEHRIVRLLKGPALTFVIRGRNGEAWGFRTVMGKVPWQRYVAWTKELRVLWCDDRPISIETSQPEAHE